MLEIAGSKAKRGLCQRSKIEAVRCSDAVSRCDGAGDKGKKVKPQGDAGERPLKLLERPRGQQRLLGGPQTDAAVGVAGGRVHTRDQPRLRQTRRIGNGGIAKPRNRRRQLRMRGSGR